jgi:hypothetical protein
MLRGKVSGKELLPTQQRLIAARKELPRCLGSKEPVDKADAAFPRFEIRDQRGEGRGIPPKPIRPIIYSLAGSLTQAASGNEDELIRLRQLFLG